MSAVLKRDIVTATADSSAEWKPTTYDKDKHDIVQAVCSYPDWQLVFPRINHENGKWFFTFYNANNMTLAGNRSYKVAIYYYENNNR